MLTPGSVFDVIIDEVSHISGLDFQAVPPTTAFSLITELVHRDGLRPALSGRDDVLLEPILNLLVKYVSDPRFGEMACDVASIVIGKNAFLSIRSNWNR